ncbi:hypothetical protein SD457_04120 [Coprobacillaceae bacterium CR2/5/TPMF4]|nr:hypothetical protein SD457_04120 [Coprobacillaceae bacterium CR2/5/TPMF4]
MKELVLIDGNSLLYRAYYATAAMGNLMMNKDGIPTNAVFGFANMLESVLKGNPEYLVVAFDYGKRHLEMICLKFIRELEVLRQMNLYVSFQ